MRTAGVIMALSRKAELSVCSRSLRFLAGFASQVSESRSFDKLRTGSGAPRRFIVQMRFASAGGDAFKQLGYTRIHGFSFVGHAGPGKNLVGEIDRENAFLGDQAD